MARGRPGGNPDIGKKYKFKRKEEEPLTKKLTTRVNEKTLKELSKVAEAKNMSVADLIRQIFYEYLDQQDKITA